MAQIFVEPLARVFTNTGATGIGYKYYFYTTGTTTPINSYTTSALVTPNAWPVVSDANGRFPIIWLSNLGTTKVVLTDANDVVIETVDPIGNTGSSISLNDLDVRPTSYWGMTNGTTSAYTLTANPSISSYSNVQTFIFQAHVANIINPTIAISGLAAINLKKYTGQGTKVGLQPGDLQATQRYLAINDGVDVVVLNPRALPLNVGTAPTLTIATGTITETNVGSDYLLDTEGAAATDDLDTINGGNDGEIICLGLVSAARKVNIKHNTGNIWSENLANVAMSTTTQKVYLQYQAASAKWLVLFNSLSQNILQIQKIVTGAVATGSTVIPYDDTIPQITEGNEYMTLAITPKSATSLLKIDVVFIGTHGAGGNNTVALFQDSTANALAAANYGNIGGIGGAAPGCFSYYMVAGTTSSTTFRIRAGSDTAGTLTFNGTGGARRYGGVLASSITITEYSA